MCCSPARKNNTFRVSRLENAKETQPKDAVRGSESDGKYDVLEARFAAICPLRIKEMPSSEKLKR